MRRRVFDLSGLDSVSTCSEPTRAGGVRVFSRSRLAAVRAIETASSASEGAKPRRGWPRPEVYLPAGAPSATSRLAWKKFFPLFFLKTKNWISLSLFLALSRKNQ